MQPAGALAWLTKRYGDRTADLFLRAAGLGALCGISVAILFPDLLPLVWLAVVAIPANSPLSPVLPTAFEPLIMEAAKYQPAIRVALVALGSYLIMEYVNWRAYSWILGQQRLRAVRSRPWVRAAVSSFASYPAATVGVFALTPLPFWVARSLAIMAGYPVGKFLAATAAGRFPRFLLYAWLGELLRVPALLLLSLVVLGSAGVVLVRLRKAGARRRSKAAVSTSSEGPLSAARARNSIRGTAGG
jgi:hypothetical protein